MTGPTNQLPSCVVCGDPINESAGEVPCYLPGDLTAETGEYDGKAYHMNQCEDEVFAEVYCEV